MITRMITNWPFANQSVYIRQNYVCTVHGCVIGKLSIVMMMMMMMAWSNDMETEISFEMILYSPSLSLFSSPSIYP